MKKLLVLLMTAVLILSGLTTFSAETMLSREEIPIAETEIAGLVKLGIMQGGDNGLEPERLVTRAEAVTLIYRTTRVNLPLVDWAQAPFADIDGHWASDIIEGFYACGLVSGRGNRIFDPDATVTGKEFTKILLAVMGYKDVTIDNAYDIGVESGLLVNNFTRSVVNDDLPMLRSDAARLCWAALTAKLPDGVILYRDLIDRGEFNESDFDGVLFVADEAPSTFADKLNSYMPANQNYMFSPLSIKMALALAANGAEGETRDEILAACGIDDLDAYNEQAKAMIEKYSRTDIIRLDIANSVWLNESQTQQRFSEDYKARVSEYFSAEAGIVNDDTAVPTINGWVSDKTNGLIDGIISDSNFMSALVNAIYFKAKWQDEFDEAFTKPDDFTDAEGKVSQIDFMHKTDYFRYYGDDTVQIVEIPYTSMEYKLDEEGNVMSRERHSDLNVSMYAIMGESKLENAEALLDRTELNRTRVVLSMPKFKTEFSIGLNGILKNLGIKHAFNPGQAQFGAMFDQGNGFVTDVLHKTYIDVNERETEAAAVTAVMLGKSAYDHDQPVEMKLDHPFTYVIRDNINGEILFMGQYSFEK